MFMAINNSVVISAGDHNYSVTGMFSLGVR